ncbi:MAG: thiol peroxidase, partial [Chloroflexi bacterium]
TAGKVRIIASVLSVNTGVCDKELRRFNEEGAQLGDDVRMLTVSMDLPFTQKGWCAAAGVERVQTFSDYYDANFGAAYGALIKDWGRRRRAVGGGARKDRVPSPADMPALGDDPDYAAVLAAAKAAL